MEQAKSQETELFKEKYCEIKMLSNGILLAKWSGFLTPEQLRKGCDTLFDAIRKYDVKAHLSNHVDLKVVTEENKAYLTQEWFPQAEKMGLTKVAALVSPNVFTRSSVDEINETVNNTVQIGNLVIETFDNADEAEKWLLS